MLRSLSLLIVSNALASGGWSDFSRTDHFYEGAVAGNTLILATDDGVRFINPDGTSSVSTSEDGLESSNIYGIVHAASGDILTISDNGVVSAYLGNGKFAILNRSYASVGEDLVPGLAVTAGSDFHGANKPSVTLGMDVGDDEAFLAPFLDALARRGCHFLQN